MKPYLFTPKGCIHGHTRARFFRVVFRLALPSILAEAGEEAERSVGLRVSLPGETGEGACPHWRELTTWVHCVPGRLSVRFKLGYPHVGSGERGVSPGSPRRGKNRVRATPALPLRPRTRLSPGYRHPGPVSGVNPGIKLELDPLCSPPR
ncbi:hypothetical protein MBOURGENBZM_13230 [Methanoculleus bourgensis]|nr:hypothetical protein MBOURGENBZM_13230 [Methanoculleus bourgensis]